VTHVASRSRSPSTVVALLLAAGAAVADDPPLAPTGARATCTFAGGEAEREQVQGAIEGVIASSPLEAWVVRPSMTRTHHAGAPRQIQRWPRQAADHWLTRA